MLMFYSGFCTMVVALIAFFLSVWFIRDEERFQDVGHFVLGMFLVGVAISLVGAVVKL